MFVQFSETRLTNLNTSLIDRLATDTEGPLADEAIGILNKVIFLLIP